MSALGRYYSSSTGRIAGTIENDESTLCESFTRKMHIQDSTSGKPTGEVYEDDDKVIIDCRKATPETAGRPQGNDARLFKRDITDAYTQQALRHPQIYHKYETRRSTRVIIDYSAPAAFRHPSAPEGFEDPDDCEWNRSVIPGHPAPQEYIEDPDEREWNKSVIFPPTCRYPSPHEDIKHRDERGWDNLIAQCIGTTAAVKNSLATIAEGENTNLKWEDQCRAQALENAKAKNANQSGGQTPAGVESDWDCDWNKSVPQESLIALAAEKFGGIWARTSQKIGGYWGSAVPSADGQSPLWRTMSVTKTVERQNQQEEGVQQKEGGPGGRTSFEDNSVAKENGMCYESSYESDELDLAESKLKKTHPPSRSLELAKAAHVAEPTKTILDCKIPPPRPAPPTTLQAWNKGPPTEPKPASGPKRPPSKNRPCATLYIARLPADIEERTVYLLFRPYGPIDNIRFFQQNNTYSAYIDFATTSSAINAYINLPHGRHFGMNEILFLDYSRYPLKPRDKKKVEEIRLYRYRGWDDIMTRNISGWE